jgi:hypothetical protein
MFSCLAMGWLNSSPIEIKKYKALTLKYGLRCIKNQPKRVHLYSQPTRAIRTLGYEGHNHWHTVYISVSQPVGRGPVVGHGALVVGRQAFLILSKIY